MAIYYELRYTSRIAQHRHILWSADQCASQGMSVPDFQKDLVREMPMSLFDQNMAPLAYGRFYPAQILKTFLNPPGDMFRITEMSDMEFTTDFNHPLAGKDSMLEQVSLQSEVAAVGEPAMLLQWAGIDAPLNEQDTDYSMPHAFDRQDPSDDAFFYKQPRKVIHVDQTCISRITALYSNLVRPEDTVLDLMSSWRSHLPAQGQCITGLGMNALEMADNPQLHSHVVRDLNRDPALPFDDRAFHAVVNTVSIEYLTDPDRVFSEVRRILKPRGLVIVTFSNRYFPPKITRLWTELHPAERLGWVLQLLQRAGFSDLHCLVERGLQRSQDDRYAGQVEEMDPLFAVWGKADLI